MIKVLEKKKNQVVLAFIPFQGEHVTLHLQNNGSILKTHHDINKPKSTWDSARVEVARSLEYKDPERHGQYYDHSPLMKICNVSGYYLCGRRINLAENSAGKNYVKERKIIIDAPKNDFMLDLYLSTDDNPYLKRGNPFLETSIGKIFMEFKAI